MPTRHFKPEMRLNFQGLDLRIVQGDKAPVDLRLDMYVNGSWVPVRMELPLMMCDFFADNERALEEYRPNWRNSGDGYFVIQLKKAIKHGWQVVADEIRRQRERRAS